MVCFPFTNWITVSLKCIINYFNQSKQKVRSKSELAWLCTKKDTLDTCLSYQVITEERRLQARARLPRLGFTLQLTSGQSVPPVRSKQDDPPAPPPALQFGHQVTLAQQILQIWHLTKNSSQNPDESSGLVQKLISQRNTLIQPGIPIKYTERNNIESTYFSGLSFVNSTNYFLNDKMTVRDLQNTTNKYKVGCVINLENWTKWLLGDPIYYFKYGSFLPS